MANIGRTNPNTYEDLSTYIAVPKGEWNAIVVSSEVNQSTPNDPCIDFELKVIDGICKDGIVKMRVYNWSPEKKGEMGRKLFKSLMVATGVLQEFEDTVILHNIPVTIKTDIYFKENKKVPGEMIGFADIKSFCKYKGPQAAGADPVQPSAPTAPAQTAPVLPGFGGPGGMPSFGSAPVAPQFAPPAMPGFGAPAQTAPPVATSAPAFPAQAPGFPAQPQFAPQAAPVQQPQFQGFPMPGQQPQGFPAQAPGFPPQQR